MLELYFLKFLSILFNISRCICKCKFIVYKGLYNLFLPDVASASIAAFTFVLLVLSLHVMLVEDDEANKV